MSALWLLSGEGSAQGTNYNILTVSGEMNSGASISSQLTREADWELPLGDQAQVTKLMFATVLLEDCITQPNPAIMMLVSGCHKLRRLLLQVKVTT